MKLGTVKINSTTHAVTHIHTKGQATKQTARWADGRTYIQTHKYLDRQTDRHTDRQTDR